MNVGGGGGGIREEFRKQPFMQVLYINNIKKKTCIPNHERFSSFFFFSFLFFNPIIPLFWKRK